MNNVNEKNHLMYLLLLFNYFKMQSFPYQVMKISPEMQNFLISFFVYPIKVVFSYIFPAFITFTKYQSIFSKN